MNSYKQNGGDGAHGRTVYDSSYHGRPEYNFYTASEMLQLGAKVGGGRKQRGGDGAHGHTVIDSSFYGVPEKGFYSGSEMTSMGAKVGGAVVYKVEGLERKKQRGGYQNEQNNEHQKRIKGIINNMINVSDSSDDDIIDVLRNELKSGHQSRYSKKEAEQILKEFYVFHPEKTTKNRKGLRRFPSNLLGKYINANQTGGNRVTLPLTFFTGEIPDKIVVPTHVDNYCDRL
jgi:hypothetical protein